LLYLLDANVLIDANRDYYPMDRVPEFWAWLRHYAGNGTVKLPQEIFGEPKSSSDELAKWLKKDGDGSALLLKEEVEIDLVRRVIEEGYAPNLTDEEVVKIGNDPFLIAYALAKPTDRRVVTTEASKPSAQRANRRVPDVCSQFGVTSINTFQFIRELDFTTSWKV
jgi:hypothetical protein